jgi:uncharacterized protein
MRRALVLITFLLAQPPAGAAPSFDCAKARSETEKLICNYPPFEWSDRQMARLYALALKEVPPSKRAPLIESQRHFLIARDACRTVGCVTALYEGRLKALAALVNVHDAYATFARGDTGGIRIARFGYDGAVDLWASADNGYDCEFRQDNLLQTGKGVLRWRQTSGRSECRLDIIPDGDDMRIEVKGCRSYCGPDARMDGTYTRVR